MSEPQHHLGDAFRPRPVGESRPSDHDAGQAQFARGVDLGTSAGSSRVAGDDPLDAAGAHQLQFAGKCEWTASHDDIAVGKRQRLVRWIDKSQGVGVLRPGAERGNVLAADREKDPGAWLGQCRDRGSYIRYLDPVVAARLGPWRSFERHQWRTGRRTGLDSVAAHPGSKRVGGIDDVRNPFPANVVGKPAYTAETADPRRQLLLGERAGAASIGIDRLEPLARDSVRKQMGTARSAQDEGAHHA
jgi:hypothetical protein